MGSKEKYLCGSHKYPLVSQHHNCTNTYSSAVHHLQLKQYNTGGRHSESIISEMDACESAISCRSSQKPSPASTSIQSAASYWSYSDEGHTEFTTKCRESFSALLRDLVSYWSLHVEHDGNCSKNDSFNACPQYSTPAENGSSSDSRRDLLEPVGQSEDQRCASAFGQEDDGGYSGGGRKRRANQHVPSSTEDRPLLSYSFYKYDASRYSEVNVQEKEYRGCSSVCFIDISRLKQHLHRVRSQPKHCCGSRYEVFSRETFSRAIAGSGRPVMLLSHFLLGR